MELDIFIQKFATQFEETESAEIYPEVKFKELTEWSSLLAMSIIAMVDEEYHVVITGADIRNNSTIEDLYKIVRSRL